MIKKSAILFTMAILFYSCVYKSEKKETTIPKKVESTTVTIDTAITKNVDTISTKPVKPPVYTVIDKMDKIQPETEATATQIITTKMKKSAVLGYSYFTNMKQDETRSIYAQVRTVNAKEAIDKLAAQIKEDLQSKNTQVTPERKSDTATYLTGINIYYFKYLTITLNDPDSNFKIDSLDYRQRQLIDTAEGEKNLRQWAVTPKTSVKYARLYLKVVAEKEDGTISPIDSREFNISIQLETNFWRTLVDWLRKNPEKLLVLILIPIVSYLGKKIFDYFKSKNNNSGGTA